MATKKRTTKKPHHLGISRNGMHFTFSWKIGDKDYGEGQLLQWRINGMGKGKWYSIAIGKTATQKTLTSLTAAGFYPYTNRRLNWIEFRVRGRRKNFSETRKIKKKIVTTTYVNRWSPWETYTLPIAEPWQTGGISVEVDSSVNNRATFTWSENKSDTNNRPTASCNYQTTTVKNIWTTDGSKYGGYSGDVGGTSATFTEDSAALTGTSLTRFIRTRQRGASGSSAFRYAYHTYAMPHSPVVTYAKTAETDKGRNTTIRWSQSASAAYPVDTMTAQYAIETPESDMSCPSGASWNDALTMAWRANLNGCEFNSTTEVGQDKCMWVKVSAKHDNNVAYSEPYLVEKGKLKAPTLTSGTATSSTKIAVSATNNSEISGVWLEAYIKLASDPSRPVYLGKFTGDSAEFTVSDISGESTYQVGVMANNGSMKSDIVWTENSAISLPPSSVRAEATAADTVKLTWDWPWSAADQAVISWADHADAWESTEEPSSYTVDHKALSWSVGGLDEDKKYYFRVRLAKTSGDTAVYSNWSEIVSVNIASMPALPVLAVSNKVIVPGESISFSVGSTGAGDFYAEIAEKHGDAEYTPIIGGSASSSLTITMDQINELYTQMEKPDYCWTVGSEHAFCTRITGAGGQSTDWSDPVTVKVVYAPEIITLSASTKTVEIASEDENGTSLTESVQAITELPVSVTIQPAGGGLTFLIALKRYRDVFTMRPDEQKEQSYKDEIIAVRTAEPFTGAQTFSFDLSDLLGIMNDGGWFYFSVSASDVYGHTTVRKTDPFLVKWDQQPIAPGATLTFDTDRLAAKIAVTKPEGAADTDTVNIYRLSADKPVQVIEGGTYGVTYVDPYPAFGEPGGYRVVSVSKYGDYIAADSTVAWIDAKDEALDVEELAVDFDGYRVMLPFDIKLSNSWAKDFKRTTYLGGSVQGDWNPGVTRDLSAETTTLDVDIDDQQTQKLMRRLADHAGICHIRTPEGSSFAADVQVSEDRDCDTPGIVKFKLAINKVDPEGMEGMTLAEWETLEDGA